jgi:hypothetical protein
MGRADCRGFVGEPSSRQRGIVRKNGTWTAPTLGVKYDERQIETAIGRVLLAVPRRRYV